MDGLTKLRPFIGRKLQVINGSVITEDGEFVYSDYKVKEHSRHHIECVTYGGDNCNITIECWDCNEVIIDSDLLDAEEVDE